MDARVLRAPGGFAWWYVDLVTPEGDGAVVIWSYGLPFLPGYAQAARRGTPQLPLSRPSMNLVLYRRGRPVFYLLQEHPAAEVSGDPTYEQRIGGCTFVRRVAEGACTLDAEIDCELPGSRSRVSGSMRLRGVARGADKGPSIGSDALHLWTPLTGPAEAALDLAVDGTPIALLRGRAYHDRNSGGVPLHALGIHRWMWGRFPFPDHERIYYLLWPRSPEARAVAVGVRVDAEGRTEQIPLEVELGRERMAFGGLRRPDRITLRHGGERWLEVRHTNVSDAGPFYLRLLSEGKAEGARVTGWSELVQPERVDLSRHRPFVRMRVHRSGGPNSLWLPLFTGPREGRVSRLLRTMLRMGGR